MPPATIPDYYQALGVPQGASSEDIKRAYRTLAKQCHPDAAGDDKSKEAKFKDISVAYGVIGDPEKRKQYDASRLHPGGFVMPPEFVDLGDVGELFGAFFNYDRDRSSGRARRADAASTDPFSELRDRHERSRIRRRREEPEPVHASTRRPKPTVPASDGSALGVDGDDVYSEVRISFDRAILGTIAKVPTLDGLSEVKIPSGTSSGKMLRLRGKGISGGDHYVTVQIDVPEMIDDDAAAELAKLVSMLRRS